MRGRLILSGDRLLLSYPAEALTGLNVAQVTHDGRCFICDFNLSMKVQSALGSLAKVIVAMSDRQS